MLLLPAAVVYRRVKNRSLGRPAALCLGVTFARRPCFPQLRFLCISSRRAHRNPSLTRPQQWTHSRPPTKWLRGLCLCAESGARGAPKRLGLSLLVRCNASPDKATDYSPRFERYDWDEFAPTTFADAATFSAALQAAVAALPPSTSDDSPTTAMDGHTFVLQLPAEDNTHFPLYSHFDLACAALHTVLSAGGRALVHCTMGVSRSAAVCAAYAIRHRPSLLGASPGAAPSVEAALSLLRENRSVVDPNPGFLAQLRLWTVLEGVPGNDRPSSLRERIVAALCAADDGGTVHWEGFTKTTRVAIVSGAMLFAVVRRMPFPCCPRCPRPTASADAGAPDAVPEQELLAALQAALQDARVAARLPSGATGVVVDTVLEFPSWIYSRVADSALTDADARDDLFEMMRRAATVAVTASTPPKSSEAKYAFAVRAACALAELSYFRQPGIILCHTALLRLVMADPSPGTAVALRTVLLIGAAVATGVLDLDSLDPSWWSPLSSAARGTPLAAVLDALQLACDADALPSDLLQAL